MLIPYLNGIVWFAKAPMTWLLFFMNFFVFIYFMNNQNNVQNQMRTYFEKNAFVANQGILYSQFIRKNPASFSPLLQTMSKSIYVDTDSKAKIMGQLAFRDALFMEKGTKENYSGDQVAVENWKDNVRQIASIQKRSASFQYGLSHEHSGPMNWLTYQFMHADWTHLMANMFFLLIFGAALEPVVGSGMMALIYFVAGVAAAYSFSLLSGFAAVPLIGASGSISGLMGLFAGVFKNRPVKFFYWLLPRPNYVGFLFLPAWVALAMWSLLDLGGLLGSVEELGGTAHAAHLGGALFGLVIGLVLFRGSKATA